MSMPDTFLSSCMGGDALDWQVHLNEAFAISRCLFHKYTASPIPSRAWPAPTTALCTGVPCRSGPCPRGAPLLVPDLRNRHLVILRLRLQNFMGAHMVVLYLHHRLPPQARRILDHVHLRLCSAVEHHVEPVVLFKPLSGFVLVGRQ